MIESVSSAGTHVSVRLLARQRVEPSRQAKLEVVRELLAALDTATIPGQHYVMDRVIGVLGQEVSRASGRMSDWQRQSITGVLAELVRQAARLAPDEATWRARAEMLTDVLRVVR
jgi:hypothetical protein